MTSRDFCFWLQGFFEIVDADGGIEKEFFNISPSQVKIIRNHLALAFAYEIDPEIGDKNHQDKLNTMHQKSSIDKGKQSF